MKSFIYKLLRLSNDVSAVASGSPKRMARRGKNKIVGRKIVSKLMRWP